MIKRSRKKKAKKEARRIEKAEKEKQRQIDFNKIETDSYIPSTEESQSVQDVANELANRDSERAKESRDRNKEEAMRDITTPTQGLTPVQRQSMQESANKQIAGQLQNYQKMLASQQGWRGVRGGKGMADVNRQALNAQTQIQRDLNLQDADLSMQRLAAYLSSLEGKEASEILKNQKYWDYVTGQQDKKRNSALTRYFNQYYGTV
jgi:hypothetical protein